MNHAPPVYEDPNRGFPRALLHLFYDALWVLVLSLASPYWIVRCILEPGYRHMTAHRLGFHWPQLDRRPRGEETRPRFLVHGVSVGEVKGAQALVAGLLERYPAGEVVISTTTNTGEAVAKKVYPELQVVRMPIDISLFVARFLRRIAPTYIVLIELEIWPNLLRQANRAGCPLAVVNGRITPRSYERYQLFRDFLPQFNRVSLYCVQDEEYAERFDQLIESGERTVLTGNIKVDGLKTGRVEPSSKVKRLLSPRAGQRTIVGGSTHEPEERLLMEAWQKVAPSERLILVPRHPERGRELASRLASELGVRPQLWSELDQAKEAPDPVRPCIVDVIGELESVYGLADLVFVGGSLLPHGGQNMLEPAAQGRAVLYGPNVANFVAEAGLLEKAGASRRLAGEEELGSALAQMLSDDALRERMGQAGIEAVEAQKGATRLTLDALDARVVCAPE